jgi:VanZ family protein
LFFVQVALVVGASVLATTGHLPWRVFQTSPVDKIGHLIAYGGLSFLGVAFFGHARRFRVVLILLAAATVDEVSQLGFATRTFDLGDLAMNVVGICLFGAVSAARAAVRQDRSGR